MFFKYEMIKRLAVLFSMFLTLSFTSCNGMHISGNDDLQLIQEKTFSISPGNNLFVDITSGDVTITSWDKAEVYVKIFGNENAMEKMEFILEGNEEMVKVIGKKKSSISSWFSNVSVEVEIKVPAEFNLNVNTSGGDIKYGGISGQAELNTSGGNVWGEKFMGFLNISTSGGDISLIGSDTKINAETSGGDIVVKLPEEFKASMELSTSGGDVSCSLNMSNVKKSSGSWLAGDLNGGGENLTAHTSGGDITVTGR